MQIDDSQRFADMKPISDHTTLLYIGYLLNISGIDVTGDSKLPRHIVLAFQYHNSYVFANYSPVYWVY